MIHDEDGEHIHEHDAACGAPPRCPTCGTPARYFPLQASLLLDWVLTLADDLTVLQDDLISLDEHLRDLKQVIEQEVLP
jgi:hypothetical protein